MNRLKCFFVPAQFVWLAALASSVLVASCGMGGDDVPFKDKVTAYLKKDLPKVKESDGNKYAAYFDFTGAMIACNDAATSQTFNGLCQRIMGSSEQFDVFKLGNAKITRLTGEVRPAKIFAQLQNAPAQMEYYAPIEQTLDSIVKQGRPAVLVTDFEEYTPQGELFKQAYATPYFKKWLDHGGDISFFITDYQEGNISKHLYYVVFDYNEHSLLKLVEDGLHGLPKNYERFKLSTISFPMYTRYSSDSKGGTYHDAEGDDIVSFSIEDGTDDGFFSVEGLRAECYVFDASWPDIVGNVKMQCKENGADGKDGNDAPFTHLFRHLFIDLSQADSYRINRLDVRVTDVQRDLDAYWAWQVASQNPPVIQKDGDEVYLDFTGHEAGESYYDETGKLLPEYDYSRQNIAVREIKDMLVFDNELFQQTYKDNSAAVELGIKFVPGFNGEINGVGDEIRLYRVDIVVSSAEMCDLSVIDTLFGWTGNDCLAASVKNTLQDMNPRGRVLYSYFIRIK